MNTTKYMPNIHLFSFTIVYRSGMRTRPISISFTRLSFSRFFETTAEEHSKRHRSVGAEAKEETLGVGQRIFVCVELCWQR